MNLTSSLLANGTCWCRQKHGARLSNLWLQKSLVHTRVMLLFYCLWHRLLHHYFVLHHGCKYVFKLMIRINVTKGSIRDADLIEAF